MIPEYFRGSALIYAADAFAVHAHKRQDRKYVGGPYVAHPRAVAQMVHEAGLPDEAVAAALLHDVIEDCDVSHADLVTNFGQAVADLVLEVTDVSKPEDGNRKIRKALDRDHLAKASKLGQSIKMADLIHNTSSIVEHDPDFAVMYLYEKRAVLKVLTKADSGLSKLAWQSLGAAWDKVHHKAK